MRTSPAHTHLPTVHPVYLRLLAEALDERGFDVEQVLAAANLVLDDLGPHAPPVAFNKVMLLLQHVTAQGADPLLPASWGRKIKPAVHGTVGMAVFSASTLREALETWAALLPLRTSIFQFSLSERDDTAHFEFKASPSMEGLTEFITTVVSYVCMQVFQSLIGRRVKQIHVAFPFPQPAWVEGKLDRFPWTVSFKAPSLDFRIPRELLDLSCATADARAFEAALRQAELDKLSSHEGLSARLSAHLACAQSTYPNLEEVADAFCMSPRTLRRQLQNEGISFQVLLDQARMDSARRHLADTDLSVQQITDRLGYGDPSNFIRAFKRHHGCTPKQYRDNLA